MNLAYPEVDFVPALQGWDSSLTVGALSWYYAAVRRANPTLAPGGARDQRIRLQDQ